MSAVTVVVVLGFVCCALAIRVIGMRQDRQRSRVVRVHPYRASAPTRAMMDE
ncbi:hypothetical protein ACFXNW_12190 [Nocardia sp. NPDC059180]|uniref:hypothetical protein n=1 Tax=Nocardia sp. NPDC059180 TaxID=3346761 RepID=UPI00367864AD